MEQEKNDIWQFTMTYGAILGIILVIISVLLYLLGLMKFNILMSIVIFLINVTVMVTVVVIGTKRYRDEMLGGYIDFGKAFLVGLLIVVFSSVLTTFYNVVFNTFIDPEYYDRTIEAAKEWTGNFMYSKGVPEEQIDQALEQMGGREKPSVISMILGGIMAGAIGGSIVSLITAAILKKEPFDSR
jgi:uncharacterized membrane protein YhaH (DUF805 family)